MITFPALGRHGRLGNQLFQIAATVATAVDRGVPYGFPYWSYESCFGLHGCFYPPGAMPEEPEYREQLFSFSPIPAGNQIALHGHFQSERFFVTQAPLIHQLLAPRTRLPRQKGVCSVHVRRGDYLNLINHHPVLGRDYYEAALEAVGGGPALVFSDDPEWCRGVFLGDRFQVAPPADDWLHLAQMIACEHHVIANSSFSWWGAWLDPTPGVVVAPSAARWFGPALSHLDVSDLIPSRWLLC